jgi:hypothetical protein
MRVELAIGIVLAAAPGCRSKSDAQTGSVASAVESAAPAPTDPDEIDRAGAPVAAGSTAPLASGSASPRRERTALPLPPTSMPDPPPPPTMRPDAGGYGAVVAIFDGYGFPAHPRVEHLCARRVYQAGGRHLTWDAFASNDEPQNLVAHFKFRLGDKGFSAQGGGGVWRLPAGAPTPARTLTVLSTGQLGPHDDCQKKPAPTAKAVLILSRDH